MENQNSQHILKALEIADQLLALADSEVVLGGDASGGILAAAMRDCAYKIKHHAQTKHGIIRTKTKDGETVWRKKHSEGIHLKKAMVLLLVVFVLSLSAQVAQAAYVDVVEALNPLGYWRLGESSGTTATDYVGNCNGTYSGGVTLGVTGALTGDSDTAASFDGTDGRMITMSSSSLRLTGDMSVSMCVNIDTFPGASATDPLFTIEADAQGSGVAKMAELTVDQSGDLVYTHEYGEGGSGSQQRVFASSNLLGDTWYNIVVTRDATAEEVTLYIQGDLLGTFSYNNQAEGYGNGTLYLGKYGTDLFYGSIDEIAVFDYKLTGQNVTDIFTAAQVPEPATVCLLGLGALALIRRR